MILDCETVKARLLAKGPEGKSLSALINAQTDGELRELILRLAEKCPAGPKHPHCPFFSLGSLTEISLKNLLDRTDRHKLMEQFAHECECRNGAL